MAQSQPSGYVWRHHFSHQISGMSTSRLCPEALVPTICVRHGTEYSVVLLEHHTLLYGKPKNTSAWITTTSRQQSSWKHVVNHLRSECEKSPNNYKIDSSICARHTIMTRKHYTNTEGHWTQHQMEVTLICHMCKYPINLFWNLDGCLLA